MTSTFQGRVQVKHTISSHMPNSGGSKPRLLRSATRLFVGLALIYLVGYFVLSLLGTYRPVVSFSGGITREHLFWAPPGFYSAADQAWQRNVVSLAFYPIWN